MSNIRRTWFLYTVSMVIGALGTGFSTSALINYGFSFHFFGTLLMSLGLAILGIWGRAKYQDAIERLVNEIPQKGSKEPSERTDDRE